MCCGAEVIIWTAGVLYAVELKFSSGQLVLLCAVELTSPSVQVVLLCAVELKLSSGQLVCCMLWS